MSTPFLRKLRREATANPKKAGLLGLLLLVAVYFWAPLLRQWTSSSENTADSSTAASPPTGSVDGAALPPPVANLAPAAPPQFPWRQVAKAIEDDPQMRPAPPPADPSAQRDPFVDPQPPAVAWTAPEPEETSRDDVTPDELGLALSSTIVGPARRTAVINGKVYSPGRELEARDGVVFVVRTIEPWGIVLERAGKQFELELPRRSSPTH